MLHDIEQQLEAETFRSVVIVHTWLVWRVL